MMFDLPTELISSIADSLDWRDVGNFRLCCKTFAAAGASHLFPHGEVVTCLTKSSLKRLTRIAAHPVIGQSVRSLHLDIDGFSQYRKSFEDFAKGYKLVFSRKLGHIESDDFCMCMACKEPGRVEKTGLQLKQAYLTYKDDQQYQQRLLQNNEHTFVWTDAIARFGKLKSITMALNNAFSPETRRLSPYRYHTFPQSMQVTQPVGLRGFEDLLMACNEADTKLHTFRAGLLSWRVFDGTTIATPLVDLGACLQQLTRFEIHMDTGDGYVPDRRCTLCAAAMRTGNLRRFIQAMTKLQVLHVSFNDFNRDFDSWPANFDDIIEINGFVPSLRRLELGLITLSAKSFLGFAAKHRSSLKSLKLSHIKLDQQWQSFLEQLQSVSDLENALVCGNLYRAPQGNDDYGERFYLHFPPQPDQMRDALSHFLINGGEFKLERIACLNPEPYCECNE